MSERIDPHLLELINGYADGELSLAEQAELDRRIGKDPELARALRQVQGLRRLVSSLGHQQAPPDIWDRVRDRIELDSLLGGTTHAAAQGPSLRYRFARYVAVAAAVALVGLLGLIAYSVLSPSRPMVVTDGRNWVSPGPTGLAGRLEVQVRNLDEMVMYMDRTLHDLGLEVDAEQYPTRRVYRLVCQGDDIQGLIARLDEVWHRFESASLYLDAGIVGQPVRVSAVRPTQLGQILCQSDPTKRVELARQIAVANTIDQGLPGRRILAAAIGVGRDEPPSVPRPVLTAGKSEQVGRVRPSPSSDGVHLTIVLTSSH